MKVIILAGGFGSRLAEETAMRPKPMVEIGGQPILMHLLNVYSAYGFRDFIIACGYKGEMIKDYFLQFNQRASDVTIDLSSGVVERHGSCRPNWRVSVVDTGERSMTGGRLLRLKDWIGGDPFMVTYGDGLANIHLKELCEFHRGHGKLATVTAVHPPARFGALSLTGDTVKQFSEKPQVAADWINGGFFVFEPAVLGAIKDDTTILEREPLEQLAAAGQLMAYRHHGFWQPMDTLREKQILESLWERGNAPWRPDNLPGREANHADFGVLPAQENLAHRTHGLQGPLAGRVAGPMEGQHRRPVA